MATFYGQHYGDSFAHEAITVSSTSIGGTAATYNPSDGKRGAKAAYVSVESQNIRVRFDGSAPTASTGHAYAAGSSFAVIGGENVKNLRMIRETASDATVRITYLR